MKHNKNETEISSFANIQTLSAPSNPRNPHNHHPHLPVRDRHWDRNRNPLAGTHLVRVLSIASAGAAHARTWHLQLLVLVVRLIGQQHPDLAPPVEEQGDGSGPDHQYDQDDADLHATDLHKGDSKSDISRA